MNQVQLGQTVRDRRQRLRLSQRELAEIAGLSAHTLSDIESGRGNPTLQVLDLLTQALGLELRLALRETGTGVNA